MLYHTQLLLQCVGLVHLPSPDFSSTHFFIPLGCSLPWPGGKGGIHAVITRRAPGQPHAGPGQRGECCPRSAGGGESEKQRPCPGVVWGGTREQPAVSGGAQGNGGQPAVRGRVSGGAAGRARGSPGVSRGAAGRTRGSARRAPALAGGGAAAAAATPRPVPARPSPGSGEEMT